MSNEGTPEFDGWAMRWWYPLLVVTALAGLYVLGRELGLREELKHIDRWAGEVGPMGPVLFVAAYTVLTSLGFPGSPLTAAAGGLFGAWGGIAVSLIASTVASTLSFLIARHLTPNWFRRRLAAARGFGFLDRLARNHGMQAVLTARLAHVFPFALINYGFGLTGIRLGTYVLWSLLGMVPGTIVLVVGTDTVLEALRYRQVSWLQLILVLVTALTLVLGVCLIRRWTRDEVDDS